VTNVSQPESGTMESFSNAVGRNFNGLRQETCSAGQEARDSKSGTVAVVLV
jgi:hypothetical protein